MTRDELKFLALRLQEQAKYFRQLNELSMEAHDLDDVIAFLREYLEQEPVGEISRWTASSVSVNETRKNSMQLPDGTLLYIHLLTEKQ